MEFKKENIFTIVNADELRPGDKVICANDLQSLKEYVLNADEHTTTLDVICGEYAMQRFCSDADTYALAYLVERKENCGNCRFRFTPVCHKSKWSEQEIKLFRCDAYGHETEPKTEPKAESHYRPFKDVNELVKVWLDKGGKWQKRELTMPHIWVRLKDENAVSDLITGFGEKEVKIDGEVYNFEELMNVYEFLDGSPCGVEE